MDQTDTWNASLAALVPDTHGIVGSTANIRTSLPAAIHNDAGTGMVIPTPFGTPSLSAVMGPSEDSVIAHASAGGATAWAAAANSLQANEQSIISQIAQSAANGGVAQQLGPQLAMQDVNTSSSSGTTSGSVLGGGVIVVIGLIIVGALGWYFWKRRHKAST